MKKFKHYKNKKRSGFGFALDLKIKIVLKAIHELTNTFININQILESYVNRE